MYRFLRNHLPAAVADGVMTLWYFILLLLVFYCALEPLSEFRYLNL